MKRIICLLMAIFLLSSCKIDLDADDNVSSDPDTLTDSKLNNLQLSLTSNYLEYSSGEIVQITAIIENKADTIVSLFQSCPGAPVIHLFVNNSQYDFYQSLTHPEDLNGCPAIVDRTLLKPGEKITRDVFWNLTMGHDIVAPSGKYEINASVILTDENYKNLGEVKTSGEIIVGRGLVYIPILDAIALAFKDSVLQNWYRINNYEQKCLMRNSNENRFVQFESNKAIFYNDNTQNKFDEFTPTIPGCTARLVEGPYWQIKFFNKFGDIAGEFTYSIDAVTGDIVDSIL